MKSSTEVLRAMLDERGVEWRERVWGGKHSVTTFWHARGVRWHYRENRFGEVRLHADGLTPEQAIEATLGRGECEKLPSDGITRCFVRRYGYEREFGYWKCSACGCECFEGARYCMGCGRKVRA